jgi:hypothetical protein
VGEAALGARTLVKPLILACLEATRTAVQRTVELSHNLKVTLAFLSEGQNNHQIKVAKSHQRKGTISQTESSAVLMSAKSLVPST